MTTIDPAELLKRIDLTVLYKPFADKLPELLTNCQARGAIYVATCGVRTWDEQAALYAKGRTIPPLGHFVTKANAGQSPHNYNVAVDFCKHSGPWAGHLNPDYTDSHYLILAEEAEKLGLEAGYRWQFKDTPHIQVNVKKMGFTWSALSKIYHDSGIKGIFAELDKHTL